MDLKNSNIPRKNVKPIHTLLDTRKYRVLHVKNVSPEVETLKLKQFFSFCGTVLNIEKIVGKEGQKSDVDYFVVEFSTPKECEVASKLDHTFFMGSYLKIEKLIDVLPKENGKTYKKVVHISNLANEITHQDLVNLFSFAGPIVFLDLPLAKDRYQHREAFIEFETEEASAKAINTRHMSLFKGQLIHVLPSKFPVSKPQFFLKSDEIDKVCVILKRLNKKISQQAIPNVDLERWKTRIMIPVIRKPKPTVHKVESTRPKREYSRPRGRGKYRAMNGKHRR